MPTISAIEVRQPNDREERRKPDLQYKLGGYSAGIGVAVGTGTLVQLALSAVQHITVQILALALSMFVAFTGVYFQLRTDRREAQESVLRIKELERKLAQLEAAQQIKGGGRKQTK